MSVIFPNKCKKPTMFKALLLQKSWVPFTFKIGLDTLISRPTISDSESECYSDAVSETITQRQLTVAVLV